MRRIEVVAFCLAVVAFLAALIVAGSNVGDIFWRVGVAILLADIVMIMLWPPSRSATE